MIREIRLFLQLARPVVLLLLGLFAAIGATSSGAASHPAILAEVYFIVLTFLVFSVAANDLADLAIDRVNLPGDRRRPLVAGTARHRDMVLLTVVSVVACVGVAALVNLAVLLTTVCGIAVSAAYSLPPSRLSARGAVASLVLPACYVACRSWSGSTRAGQPFGRRICCCWLRSTSASSAGSCSRISVMFVATRCSVSARSWSGTAAARPACSAPRCGRPAASC